MDAIASPLLNCWGSRLCLLASGGTAGPEFYAKVGGFLAIYYLFLAMMNAGAALYLWQVLKKPTHAIVWLAVAALFVILAPMAGSGNINLMPSVPMPIRQTINAFTGPVIYTLGTTTMLLVMFLFREFFVRPVVAWSLFNIVLLLMGLSMTDSNFVEIVAKADNVPIVMLVYLLGFFTWLSAYKAVQNDQRAKEGLPPLETLDGDKVLVWPDLVYTELICMVVLTAGLILWGILLQAPLEEPGSSVKTPNPSKAPWYFLGLQEMLVYYDPWMAGVVLPSMIVLGLMAIPYLDFNKLGNGYYTIAQRKFSYIIFQIGFLEMWITLIILGTFLRGPNWNFYGPFEFWDSHKVKALNNINLSDIVWTNVLNLGLPKAPMGSGGGTEFLYILLREAPGIILVLGYFLFLPPLLAVTVMRDFFRKMGFLRFMLLTNLLCFMAALPMKMVLRWVFNLKYLIYIPEYFLNF